MASFEIVNKQLLTKSVKRIDVLAPAIAQKAQPGQFVNIVPHEKSRWIPLSISEADPRRGTISLIFKIKGQSPHNLDEMRIHDHMYSVMGPLGKPAKIEKYGKIICIAQDAYAASLLPICRALKNAGNKIDAVISAKTRAQLVCEAQMRLACDKLHVTTADGSFMKRGRPEDVLKDLLNKPKEISLVYVIGSVDLMQEACAMTREKNILTRVQILANISCGMGICKACRTQVNKKIILSCQHGPEFDGHAIDYKVLWARLQHLKTHRQDIGEDDHAEVDVASKFFPGFLKDY